MADVTPDSSLTSPPVKKLKQARLPFSVIPTKDAQIVTPKSTGKKRKLSDSANGPSKAPKTPRNDENSPKVKLTPGCGKPKVQDGDNEVSSSSETDCKVKSKLEITSHTNEDKIKKSNVWDNFLRTPQRREVSTTISADSSGIVDLTDSNDGLSATNSSAKEFQGETTLDSSHSCEAADPPQSKKPENVAADTKTIEIPDKKLSRHIDNLDNKEPTETKEAVENSLDSVQEEKSEKNLENDSSTEGTKEKDTRSSDDGDKETSNNDEGDESKDDSMLSPGDHDDSALVQSSADEMTSPTSKPSTPGQLSKSRRKKPPNTNKQLEKERRKEEMEKARLERQRLKEEKERQRQEEKEKKQQEREELKQKKELEKKEKADQKEKERLEKLKQKEEEKQKKEEEKQQKLEQKKKELEEKQRLKDEQEKEKQRLKEEKERQKQLEEEQKNKISHVQQEAFKSFFTKKEKNEAPTKEEEVNSCFLQFEVKKDMKLAPQHRVAIKEREESMRRLDKYLTSQDCKRTYLKQLRSLDYETGSGKKTWPCDEEDVICMEEDDKPKQRMRVKFLMFQENYRPPYYGTWRRKSRYIHARNPFGKDTVLLDYDVDSDDEWEEEEPGESLSDCEKEKDEDEDNEDDDEEEDGFFVPHGYLSEGEGCEDEEDEVSPEVLKMRQVAKAKRWESEMNAKVAVLRTVCIGCLWWSPEEQPRTPEHDELAKYQAICLSSFPISVEAEEKTKADKNDKKKKSDINKEKRKYVPDEAIPDLIRLVHGNQWGIKKLIREFREYWRLKESDTKLVDNSLNTSNNEPQEDQMNTSQNENSPTSFSLSIRQTDLSIREIANYGQHELSTVKCWIVHKQLLEKHGLADLPIPNEWKWVTKQPEKKRKIPTPNPTPTPTPESTPCATPVPNSFKETSTPKAASSITKFTVPNMSPKISTPEAPDVKEAKPLGVGKNTQSIMKFAKPGVSPSFPVISPKPVKGDQSAKCNNPEPNALSSDAGTPKRKTTKEINPASLFTKAGNNSSGVNLKSENRSGKSPAAFLQMFNKNPTQPLPDHSDLHLDDSDSKVELKPDKNQPGIKQMFGKKRTNAKAGAMTPAVATPVEVKGTGTEESPMEIE